MTIIWDALPQNREQVIFLVNLDIGITVKSILSALIWHQIRFILHQPFEVRQFRYKTLNSFYGRVNMWELGIQSFLFLLFEMWQLQKMQNFAVFFCFVFCLWVKCMKISQKLLGGDRRHINICKNQKSQNSNWQMGHFSTLCPMSTSFAHIYIYTY